MQKRKRKRKHVKFRTVNGGLLSAQMLADQAGISKVTLSRIRKGHNIPSVATLTKLSNVLGISEMEVLMLIVPSKHPLAA